MDTFVYLFHVYMNEESSFTRILLSFLDDNSDPKTIYALQTVCSQYHKCLEDTINHSKTISMVKNKYNNKDIRGKRGEKL